MPDIAGMAMQPTLTQADAAAKTKIPETPKEENAAQEKPEIVKNADLDSSVLINPDNINYQVVADPVKRTLIFPNHNNKNFREGYVTLYAFSNDFNLKSLRASVDDTTHEIARTTKLTKNDKKTYNGDAAGYLKNARLNLSKRRKDDKIIFRAILPLPLGVSENTTISWNSEASGFNKSIVGGASEAPSNIFSYARANGIGGFNKSIQDIYGTATNILDAMASGANFVTGGLAGQAADFLMNNSLAQTGKALLTTRLDSMTLGTNGVIGMAIGDNSVHNAAMNSVAGSMAMNPSKTMMQLQGPIMNYVREAAALNGRRQLVMDQGYWAHFQGVSPRRFTVNWEIIPENHEEAMNGLELCSRLKEFSLPESVSAVEQLAPHFWRFEYSNTNIQSQLLYNDLVLETIDIKFTDNGELHMSGTPKKFSIALTFMEAKAPSADVYKVLNEQSDVFVPRTRSNSSSAIESVGDVVRKMGSVGSNGSSGGGGLGGIGGILSGIGSGGSGILEGIKTSALGKLSDAVGGNLDSITNAIGGNAGDFVSGIFGDYAGNLVKDTITNATSSAGSVLTNAIATGDFSNLGDKMKDAALAGATGTVIDYAGEIIGDTVSKITDYAVGVLSDETDSILDWVKNATGFLSDAEYSATQEAKTAATEAKESADKVKEMKEKLARIEASDQISDADKKAAREKVEAEMKKAEEAKKKAEEAKKKAEDLRKAEEAKKAEEKKSAEKQKADTKAQDDLRDLIGAPVVDATPTIVNP